MREGWKGGEGRHWNGEECPSDGRAEGREGGTGGEEMEVVRGKSTGVWGGMESGRAHLL